MEEAAAPGRRVSRRQVLTHGAAVVGALAVGGYGGARAERWAGAAELPAAVPPHDLLDDASGLDAMPVRGVTSAGATPEETAARMRPLLARAAAGQEPGVVVAGARHSMGGQSLLRDGWVLDSLPMRSVSVDREAGTMRVGAGATWATVIDALNREGFAPSLMQSNHDFSVGGSMSVNCHGWQTGSPPLASKVRRVELLRADGSVVTCTPGQELFGLALGGYGLFGVILEAELEIVPDVMLEPHFTSLDTADYPETFADLVQREGSTVELAYGRLSVEPGNLLRSAVIGTFTPDPATRGKVLPRTGESRQGLKRAIFRNSAGSDTGKNLRWWLERHVNPRLAGPVSRNSILDAPAGALRNTDPETTDILHEYFVPQAQLWPFARAAAEIIGRDGGDLLNVTVRDVRADRRSRLPYAREDVFGLVMLFVQRRSAAGERRMRAMTRSLVDAAIAHGGTFYLPYRLHATPAQLRRAHPAWDDLLAAKRRHDPHAVFRNTLLDTYGEV